MTIKELDNELSMIINNIMTNWKKCEETDALPEIMQVAFNDFRESIIEFLETNNK